MSDARRARIYSTNAPRTRYHVYAGSIQLPCHYVQQSTAVLSLRTVVSTAVLRTVVLFLSVGVPEEDYTV